MKTTMKTITAGTFIALLLIVGNANASKFDAKSLKATDSALKLENWMTDNSFWDVKSNSMVEYGQEMEETLKLENWMTNADVWNIGYTNETEASLEIENWMIDKAVWNKDVQVAEAKLTVEDWMINNEFWQ